MNKGKNNIEKIEQIHNNYINGNYNDMVNCINDYNVHKFFVDYLNYCSVYGFNTFNGISHIYHTIKIKGVE